MVPLAPSLSQDSPSPTLARVTACTLQRCSQATMNLGALHTAAAPDEDPAQPQLLGSLSFGRASWLCLPALCLGPASQPGCLHAAAERRPQLAPTPFYRGQNRGPERMPCDLKLYSTLRSKPSLALLSKPSSHPCHTPPPTCPSLSSFLSNLYTGVSIETHWWGREPGSLLGCLANCQGNSASPVIPAIYAL